MQSEKFFGLRGRFVGARERSQCFQSCVLCFQISRTAEVWFFFGEVHDQIWGETSTPRAAQTYTPYRTSEVPSWYQEVLPKRWEEM